MFTKYVAMNSQNERPQYLHICGTKLTTNRFWAWSGTLNQFINITEEHNWENLNPVNIDTLVK